MGRTRGKVGEGFCYKILAICFILRVYRSTPLKGEFHIRSYWSVSTRTHSPHRFQESHICRWEIISNTTWIPPCCQGWGFSHYIKSPCLFPLHLFYRFSFVYYTSYFYLYIIYIYIICILYKIISPYYFPSPLPLLLPSSSSSSFSTELNFLSFLSVEFWIT